MHAIIRPAKGRFFVSDQGCAIAFLATAFPAIALLAIALPVIAFLATALLAIALRAIALPQRRAWAAAAEKFVGNCNFLFFMSCVCLDVVFCAYTIYSIARAHAKKSDGICEKSLKKNKFAAKNA